MFFIFFVLELFDKYTKKNEMQAREGFFFVFWYPHIIVEHNADTTPLFGFLFFGFLCRKIYDNAVF